MPTVTFPDYTVGRYPFGWLGSEDVNRADLPQSRFIANPDGYLTGPQAGDRNTLALQNLSEYAGMLDIPAADTQSQFVSITDSYADQDQYGAQHVYLRQTLNGLPVLNSSVGIHYASDGRLNTINGGFYPGVAALNTGTVPATTLTAQEAVVEAAFQHGYDVTEMPKLASPASGTDRSTVLVAAQASTQPITAKLAYVYSAASGIRPVWEVTLMTPTGNNWFHVGVDADTGEALFSNNWADNFGSYTVYRPPVESPGDPDGGSRTVEVNPFDPTYSPYGWHDTNGVAGAEYTDTRGNNTSTVADINNTNPLFTNNTAIRDDGGSQHAFNYSLDLTQSPAAYRQASIAQLFYMVNYAHDIHAAYGFTEAAGNYQQDNYSGQGLGGDAVLADAQDGGGTDNANFADVTGTTYVGPDGQPGRIQMYLFDLTSPFRDGALSGDVVYHEFGHGVTGRLAGGPSNADALLAQQSGGMGEGWSDFFALLFDQRATDNRGTRIASGTYVLGQNPVTGAGIRRNPYSYNLAIDPINYSNYAASTEVHDAGEIWCSTLWDMNVLLCEKYGFDSDLSTGYVAPGSAGWTPEKSAGNKLALRLVEDGCKLMPANPSFVQARDAILAADRALTGGVNQREIWSAFARRQLGFGASTPSASSSSITTSTTMPPAASNPGVIAASPGDYTNTAPGTVAFTFSEAMDPTSFDVASDVSAFTGPGGVDLKPSITGFAWSAGNTVLTVTFTPPAQPQGHYALTLAPTILDTTGNPLDQNLNGTTGEATLDSFTANFGYDQTAIGVTAFNPPTGAAVAAPTTIDVKFNEAVDPASVSKADLQVSQGDVVTGAAVVGDGTTVRFSVAGLVSGRVYLEVKPNAVTDIYGFGNSSPYYSNFLIPGTITTAALAVPLAAQGVKGSLSYASPSTTAGNLAGASDLANFTITLDAGQTLNTTISGMTALTAQVNVLDPGGAVIGSGTATAAGQDVKLVGLPVNATGQYTVQVAGVNNTTGTFTVAVALNAAAVEAESNGGASNNTPATAQALAGFQPTTGGGSLLNLTGKSDGNGVYVGAESEGATAKGVNDTTATADTAARPFNDLTTSSVYYEMAIKGAVGVSGDWDWYTLGTLQSGDTLTVSQSGSPGGLGTLSDSYLELWRDNGGSPIQVTVNDDGGTGFDSLIYNLAISSTDKYYLAATPYSFPHTQPVSGSTATGTYQVGVYLKKGSGGTAPTTGGAVVDDSEAATAGGTNDSIATAQNASASWRQARYQSSVTGNIGAAGDTDVYSYSFTANDVVSFRFSRVSTGFTPFLKVLDSTGATIYTVDGFEVSNPPESSLFGYRVPTTGTYYVQLTASSTTATGSYTLDTYLSTTTTPPAAPPGPAVFDYYSIAVPTGGAISAGISSTSPNITVAVTNAAGTVLATGTAATNYTVVLNSPTLAAGTYYLRIGDVGQNNYTLTVLQNGVLDKEGNGTTGTAVSVPSGVGVQSVVGAISSATDADYYSLPLVANQPYTFRTLTPGGGPGEFVNNLVPLLDLLDPTGLTTLASNSKSAPDGRNAQVSYTPLVGGTYYLRVRGVGGTTGEYFLRTPDAVNQTPKGVSAGGPYSAVEGTGTVTLAATAFDPDGDALSYSWDLNADGVFGDATGPTVVLNPAALAALGLGDGPALRQVRVRVSDGTASVDSGPSDLNIVNAPPTATVNPVTVLEGSPATFGLSNPTDPSAADVAAGFTYSFDFTNDGTFDVVGTSPTAVAPASLYPDGPASFTAKLRITDKDGGFTDYLLPYVVQNVAPTATAAVVYTPTTRTSVDEGSTALVRFTNPFDPSADDRANTFHYAYDFNNDGVFDVGGDTYATSAPAAVATVPASYLADGPATRRVRMRIYDKDDVTATNTVPNWTEYFVDITVANVAPTAKFASLGPVPEGTSAQVRFTNPVDPSQADKDAGLRYSYDFNNDGTFDLGDGTYAGSSGVAAQVAVPASYIPNNGTYTIHGRIIDKDGGSTDYTVTQTVTNVNPTATFTNAGPVPEGGTTTVTLGNATDPSPRDAAALHFAFDFDNDGTFDLGDGTYAGSGTAITATVLGKYFPDGPGTVLVHGRVIDPEDGYTDYTTPVTVTNVNPTVTVANSGPVNEASGATVTFSNPVDPSPVDTVSGFRYAVQLKGASTWLSGDGTYNGSKLSPTALIPASLFPDGPGTVTLTARILDKDGGYTDTDTVVTVNNVAPTATFANGGSVVEGQTGTVTFSAPVDPSAADTTAGFRYAYDFDNDGKFDLGDGTYTGGASVGASVTVPASYFPDGGPGKTRTVRGRILDKDGGFTDYTTTISIVNAPPTGIPGNGGPVTEGSTGSVSLTAVTDPSQADAASLHFAYDFDNDGKFDLGDGTYAGSVTAATATVPASFLDDGPVGRVVRIRVIDKDGGFSQYTTTIPVTNVAPTATFFNPGAVAEGSTGAVTFSGPVDPSTADTKAGFRYAYDFNNDGTFDVGGATYADGVTTPTATVPASYFADGPGTVTVKGRILDKDGGFTDYTTTITVTNVAPTATLGYTATGPDGKSVLEGQPATVTFTGASDPSTADTAAGFKYAFDYNNDGVFDEGDGTYAGGVGPTGTVPAALLDSGPGTRTVRGRILDRDGGFTDVVLTLTIANVAPTAVPVFGPTVTIGTPSTLALTNVFDPSAGDTAAGFTYSFDFNGDGQYEVSGSSPTASTTYTKPGVYTVGLRVSDRNGGSTSYSGTLAVNNVAPTATFASLGPVPEGSLATVRFSNPQHPSADTTAAGFRYAYDLNNDGKFELGDGTYAGSVPNTEVNLPPALTADAGTRTVKARIIEVNGLYTDFTTTVTVTDVAPTATPIQPVVPAGGFVTGDTVTIGVTQPTDPSPTDRANITYSYDFNGDGTFEITGSKNASASSVYPTAGSFTAVERVSDPKGGYTDYQFPVVIGTVPPPPESAKPKGYSVGSDTGGGTARLFNDAGGEVYSGQPFGADFTAGVRVATADVTGDGVPDLVVGTGPGVVTRVLVIDGATKATVFDVQPFESTFTGGVYVAAGDSDGDGKAEIAVTADQGGGPVVALYTMAGQKARFFGIEDPDFRGGARAAFGDVNGDGKSDLLVAAGFGGGPRLAGFDGPSLTTGKPVKLFADFFVFEQTLRNGVFIAAGDLNKDGKAEVVVGGGPGGGPRVMALDGAALIQGRQSTVANFFAGDTADRNGVRVTVKDINLDGDADILAGTADPTADGFRVRTYAASDLLAGNVKENFLLDPFPGVLGGVFVG